MARRLVSLARTPVGPRSGDQRVRLSDASGRTSAWLLGLLVAGSTVAYGLTTRHTENIWILPDELTYADLARSFATTGRFALRGIATLAYPVGYPALIAPVFAGLSPESAYEAAKWLNALLLSLGAIPVFLLARRLLSNWMSLLAVALTLLIPSFAYAGVLLSENAFFPLFLVSMLAIVRVLEHPTRLRQLAALVSFVPVIAVRTEGLILVPILVAATVIVCLTSVPRGHGFGGLARELRAFRATLVGLPAAVVAIVLLELALGRSPGTIFGRYSHTLSRFPIGRTLLWFVYQTIDLELYLVVLPLVAAIVVTAKLLTRSNASRSHRALAATSAAATLCALLVSAVASSRNQGGAFGYPSSPPELHDRYCFFVAPLILILFLAWTKRRAEFSNRVLVLTVAGAGALPLWLPYADVHTNADFDALALLPWKNSLVGEHNVHFAMAVTALALGGLLLLRRPSAALLQVGLVATFLWFVGTLARTEMASASLFVPTSHPRHGSWIDRAVPHGDRVAVLWARDGGWSAKTLVQREQALWRAEFLNPAVTRFFYTGSPMHYDLPATRIAVAREQSTLMAAGYRYVLVASDVGLHGRIVGRDRKAGLVLYDLR